MWPFTTGYPVRTPESIHLKTFDYIVAGGGTAGCVLASRLSEDPNTRVLLLERGPIIDTWVSRIPLISVDFRFPWSPSYKWPSAPHTALAGTPSLDMVSGKVLGGTSKINMNVYTRSVPGEYNAWAAAGRVGWGWDDVEPFFKKSEKSLSHASSPHRGTHGPWTTQTLDETFFQSTPATINAANQLGIAYTSEFNDPNSSPFFSSKAELTLDEHGRRMSTFDAFIPANVACQRRGNLFVCVESVVSKVDIQCECGINKAVGVYFQRETSKDSSGRQFYASASREVIICGGGIASPQLLLLSGVGPAEHLRSHNIPIVKELAGVGSNLQDHLAVPLIYSAPRKDTMYEIEQNKLLGLWEALKYLFTGRGLFLFPNPESFVFAVSKFLDDESTTIVPDNTDTTSLHPSNVPDIEIMHIPYTTWEYRKMDPNEGAMSYLCVLLSPKSKGTVRLNSRDPCERPTCDLGFLTNHDDYVVLRKAVRLGIALGKKVRDSGYPLEDMLIPDSESDDDLDNYIRKCVRTTFHYSSTCRMAPESDGGVVDDKLRVHGIQGLRVADASIFPTIPAAHLQAPIVMVAERCAHFVKSAV